MKKFKTIKSRLYGGFALALLLVIAGGILSYFTINSQVSQAGWVEHTYKVMNQTEQIQRLVFEMEASRRGFRATGDKKFLGPYYLSLPQVPAALAQLKILTEDNPLQFNTTVRLERHVNDLLVFWRGIGEEPLPRDRITKITEEEVGKMSLIRDDIAKIMNDERTLLADRNKENKFSSNRSLNIILLNTAIIIAIALTLMAVTFKELSSRLGAQEELRGKLNEVVALNKMATEKNWLLSGMSEMNGSLQGITNMKDVADKALFALVKYLEVPGGALYYYDGEKEELSCYAGVALPANAPQTVRLGEGVIGTAVTKRTPTVLKGIPEGYWKLSSSLGAARPDSLVCVPLWMDNELKGVIELATFSEMLPQQMQLIEVVSSTIAIAMNVASARSRVMTLLNEVQLQKEVLETQQEELRQSNEELTRQSEILQASEEELRVQEEELRQVNAEMMENNKALEFAREELSKKARELELNSRYKSEFLANMSHELRTPLNSVLILAKILQENKQENLTPKQMEYAGIIHKSGTDLLTLINDILDLSKIEAGKVDFNFEKTSLADMFASQEQLFQVVADEKKISFEQELKPGTPVHIVTDRQRVEQVIRNLLSNAFKFTPAGGTIKLVAEQKREGFVHFSVIDNGVGIPADKQQLIFEAFRQVDGSTSRKYGGTGLGLSISRELVSRLSGEISLRSEEGKGSIFSFSIPVTPDISAEEIKAEKEALEEDAFLPPLSMPVFGDENDLPQQSIVEDDRDKLEKNERPVLIVEDDAAFAGIVRDFARGKGYKTIVALTGDEGLYCARKYRPSAIILDMGLPVIDGNSLLKILKNNEELKDILVHVISANEVSGMVMNNVQGYSQKPLEMHDLESVFSGITSMLEEGFKKVLVVSADERNKHGVLENLSKERKLSTSFTRVKDTNEALAQLEHEKFDCVLVHCEGDMAMAANELKRIREKMGTTAAPIIVLLATDITQANEVQLRKYADAIIRQSAQSRDRLMDELELFLFKVKEIQTSARPVGHAAINNSVLKGKKILLADDDMRNVFSLSALLDEQGIEVVSAGDGNEALEMLQQNPDVDLVLMDIMMPGMDGYEAMRRIRLNPRHTNLPVIALTAKAMAGDREKCIEAGASDYISKPVENNKLLSLLRVWLS